jgi:hypothetical protein
VGKIGGRDFSIEPGPAFHGALLRKGQLCAFFAEGIDEIIGRQVDEGLRFRTLHIAQMIKIAQSSLKVALASGV